MRQARDMASPNHNAHVNDWRLECETRGLDHDAHVNDYRHRHIPRDANGDPVYLILPPAIRADYERRISACEAAWKEGEPLAVSEAVAWTTLFRQVNPKWLDQAVFDLALSKRTPRQVERYRDAMKRSIRYQYVRNLNNEGEGVTWDEAYAEASILLEGTHAAGSVDTMKREYTKAAGDLKRGRGGRYHMLNDKRLRKPG
jgi:hypothetical protein